MKKIFITLCTLVLMLNCSKDTTTNTPTGDNLVGEYYTNDKGLHISVTSTTNNMYKVYFEEYGTKSDVKVVSKTTDGAGLNLSGEFIIPDYFDTTHYSNRMKYHDNKYYGFLYAKVNGTSLDVYCSHKYTYNPYDKDGNQLQGGVNADDTEDIFLVK